jgi:hypothetical protein
MKTLTYINLGSWSNNEPLNSESYPETSVLPERFRSISEPSELPITIDDLNSISLPQSLIPRTDY